MTTPQAPALAERRIPHARIIVAGYAGFGKSTTAHQIARGLAPAAAPHVIDTEQGALYLAPLPGEAPEPPNTFAFTHWPMNPPFSPLFFFQKLQEVARAKPAVVIIDNISAGWTGQGGMLDMATEEGLKAKGNTHAGWKVPRDQQRQFMDKLNRFPFHIIMCVRTREKTELISKVEGVVSRGYQAQLDDDLFYYTPFRFGVRCRRKDGILQGGYFDASFAGFKMPHPSLTKLFTDETVIDESVGAAIAAYCGIGA